MTTLAPVTFRLAAGLVPDARRVSVVGPFNGWNHMVHTMTRRTGGDWRVTIYLPPGRIIYLFDVDGEFWLDPDDEARTPNAWGTEYSVRQVATTPAGAKAAAPDPGAAGPRGHDQRGTPMRRPLAAPGDHMWTAQGCREARR